MPTLVAAPTYARFIYFKKKNETLPLGRRKNIIEQG
jgi:hypothetical protein